MDTQKLYSWAKQDMNIGVLDDENEIKQAKDMNAALQVQQVDDIGMNMLGNEHVQSDDSLEAPITDQREKVAANMPPAMDVFSRKQSLVRSGNYTFLSKKGVMMKGTRSTPSKKYMKPILDNLESLDKLFLEKFDIEKKDIIQDLFRKTIIACETYIENRNPWTSEGKARLQMVKDFHDQMQRESSMFAGRVETLSEEELKTYASKKWVDVLTAVRTDNIENEKNGYKVEEGGAGTSKVYIIEKDGKKQYFKENEKCPPNDFYIIMDEPIKKLSKADDDKSKRRLGYLTEIKRLIMSSYSTELEAYLDLRRLDKLNGGLYPVILAKYSKEPAIKKMMMEILKREEENPEEVDNDREFINKELKEMFKRKSLSVIATRDAHIEAKSEVSKRNVATSRLAEFLHIGDMVAKSTLVNLTINGKQMNGMAMEEAPGELTTTIYTDAKKKAKYSPQAYRQLLNLQLFDLICGQVDRNMANYLCEKEQEGENGPVMITKIKAIDNDIAFGNLRYKDILAKGRDGLNRLRNIEDGNDLMVPAVDKAFADRILALDPKTVNYLMCDILSKAEREALIDRIKGLQKALRKRMNEEAKNPNKKKIIIEDNAKDWEESYNALADEMTKGYEQDKKDEIMLKEELQKAEANKTYKEDEKKQLIKNIKIMINNTKSNTDDNLQERSYLWGPLLSK